MNIIPSGKILDAARRSVRVEIIGTTPQTNSIVGVLSAILSPVIAFVVAYIAYQQHRINCSRFRWELYDRRLRVYKAAELYLVQVIREAKADHITTARFRNDASEVDFLFDKEVRDYVDQLYDKGLELVKTCWLLDGFDGKSGLPVGDKRNKAADEQAGILKWFTGQLRVSRELFTKHMRIR